MSKIVAVTNQKGGVGKTTTTINLGACLGIYKKKVLIVDIDGQGNATQGLGVDKFSVDQARKTSYDMLLNYDQVDPHEYVMATDFENLDIIASSTNLVQFDNEYSGDLERELVLKHVLTQLKDDYDYILIDCPPSVNLITLNALVASDSVLIPVQSEFFALEGMTQLLTTIHNCKQSLNPMLSIEGILVTMFVTNTKLSNDVYAQVSRLFDNRVYETVIRRNISLAEAPSYGKPIYYHDINSNGSRDYLMLAKEVVNNG